MAITDRKLFLSILKDGGLMLGIVFFSLLYLMLVFKKEME